MEQMAVVDSLKHFVAILPLAVFIDHWMQEKEKHRTVKEYRQ